MSLPQSAVERPVFTVMLVLIVVILGSVALSRLSVDLMPDITFPTLSIVTNYGNASPEEVETLITRPIEEAVAAVPGVDTIDSESGEGFSNVRISFTWGSDLNEAANDLRDRLDRVISSLPEDAGRPSLRKFDLSATPIMELGVTSMLSPLELRNLIDEQVEYRLERVPGIAAINVRGGMTREIHINLDPEKISSLKIPLDQVANAINSANVNIPAGSISIGNSELNIRTPGEFTAISELLQTVVLERSGSPITLEQIASIEDSWQKISRHTRINAQTGVQISLNKQSGTNTVAVARAVLNEVELINQDISQLEIFPIMDSSVFIRRSINNVGASAILGGLLAIFVLLFFLRNLISTAIISTAIPISIIATFGLLYFSGFTLNIMTLGGLALGVGMLLDNSIVVLENVYRLREIGFNPKEAAVKGTNEVAAPIVASTLTTLVVFLPLIFMQGMSGIMFKQLSFVVAFAIFISMITALTLVPMLSSKLLKYNAPDGEINHRLGRRLFDLVGNLLYSLENKYKNLLHLALNHRLLTVISAVFLLSSSLLLIPMIGRELMPEADEGELRISLEMEPGTRLEVTDAKLKQVETIVKQNVPELKHMIANSGGGAWGAARSHIAFSRLALVPKSERKRSSDDVANMLRPLLNQIPGAKIRVQPVAGMMSFRRMQSGGGRLELSIRGHDLDRAAELALNIQKIVDSVDGVTDSNISRSSGSPEELIIIDRQKAADLKLSVQKIAAMLQTVLSGTRTGYFREDGKEFDIILQLDDKDKTSFDDILNLSIINNAGEPIILKNLVRIERGTGAAQIDRQNQERITTVSANISGRDMGSIIKDIRLRLTELNIPQDFAVVFGGDYEEQKKSNRELMLGFVLALILIYMVMASQYESLKDPFVVMFSVPFAIIGVVLILFLTGTTFNIQSYIGMIMLGGIVVNNAILLVDTTNLLRREEGFSTRSAIEEAGRRRLRPILMTASTTILAMIPMALGIGEGGEAQAPLARAVIGGMLSSALITLVFVPVIYSFFEERRHKIVQ